MFNIEEIFSGGEINLDILKILLLEIESEISKKTVTKIQKFTEENFIFGFLESNFMETASFKSFVGSWTSEYDIPEDAFNYQVSAEEVIINLKKIPTNRNIKISLISKKYGGFMDFIDLKIDSFFINKVLNKTIYLNKEKLQESLDEFFQLESSFVLMKVNYEYTEDLEEQQTNDSVVEAFKFLSEFNEQT